MSLIQSSFYFSILPAILGNITFFDRDASTLGQKPLYSKYDYILAYTTYNSRRMGSCGFPLGNQSAISLYNITIGSGPSLSPSFSSPVSPSPPIGSRSPSQTPSQSLSLSPSGSSPISPSLSPSTNKYPFLNPTKSPSFTFLNPKTAGSASSGVSGPGLCTLMTLLSGMIIQQVSISFSLIQFLLSHNYRSCPIISIIVYALLLKRDLKFLSRDYFE